MGKNTDDSAFPNEALRTTFLGTRSSPRKHTYDDRFVYAYGVEYSAELHVSEKWDNSNNQGKKWMTMNSGIACAFLEGSACSAKGFGDPVAAELG